MCALLLPIAHETAGAARIRHSLRPLFYRGRRVTSKPRAQCAARSRSCILRHCERSEAIHSTAKRKNGLLRCARMTGIVRPNPQLSSSAQAEDPVRRGLSISSSASLECWVVGRPKLSLRAQRSNPCHGVADRWIASSQVLLAMTVDAVSHSRGTKRPSFAGNSSPSSKTEGAGNAGCALHPRSHVQWVVEVRT